MVEELDNTHLPDILKLLNDNQLPVSDIDLSHQKFWGIFNEDGLLGVGALEIMGTSALLRSLAVTKEYQNNGFGNQVVNTLLGASRNVGIQQLFLLTETAASFFEKNNFVQVSRSQVPTEIANTEEFKSICPSSAICMTYNLES